VKKLSIYVETSVWGMLVNEEPAIWREAVEYFLQRAKDFNLNISPIVLEEIEGAYEPIKNQ